ncbi:MAG: hypothetical protein HFH88_11015 [Lachnospiraceae bacterium]|nr:hypothetical protein [Lachnospiraceae bacterium]
MGGRGGSSGLNVANIPKINNPARIPKNAITEDEFLALRGVGDAMSGYTIDKTRSNRQIRTQRGKERFERETLSANEVYQRKRDAARAEYRSLVEKGVIRDKTPIERRIVTAHGNPDNESTQAARRLLEKKGIDWKTGRKKK